MMEIWKLELNREKKIGNFIDLSETFDSVKIEINYRRLHFPVEWVVGTKNWLMFKKNLISSHNKHNSHTITRKPDLQFVWQLTQHRFWKYLFRKFILNRRLSRDDVRKILLYVKWSTSEWVSMYEPKLNKWRVLGRSRSRKKIFEDLFEEKNILNGLKILQGISLDLL